MPPACATGSIIKVPNAPATNMSANRFMEFLLQFLQFRHAIDFGLIDAGRMPEKVRAPTDELISRMSAMGKCFRAARLLALPSGRESGARDELAAAGRGFDFAVGDDGDAARDPQRWRAGY